MSLPRRRDAPPLYPVSEVWSVGGLKTVMAADLPREINVRTSLAPS